jgi:hypothetical protein
LLYKYRRRPGCGAGSLLAKNRWLGHGSEHGREHGRRIGLCSTSNGHNAEKSYCWSEVEIGHAGPEFLVKIDRNTIQPFTLDGYLDTQGRPQTSLIVVDGEQAHRTHKASGSNGDTAAMLVLALLTGSGHPVKPS